MIEQPVTIKYPMSHVRLRSAVFVAWEGQVLLVHDPNYRGGCWMLPGGGIEFNETLIEGAVREVLEETGVTVKIKSIWRLREIWEPENQLEENPVPTRKSIEFIFLAGYVSGTIAITQSTQRKKKGAQVVKECRWFSIPGLGPTIEGVPVYPEELFHAPPSHLIKGIPLDHLMLPLLNLGGKP
jgi:8-oxo-dGTP pyrophosphatase MutT (NUDIX family)